MTKLELINYFIKETEATLDFLKSYKPSADNVEHKIRRYEYFKKNLELLNQIKIELEAWEVVKKFIRDSNGVYLLRIDSDDDYDNEYYQTLKKALEVKDDSTK